MGLAGRRVVELKMDKRRLTEIFNRGFRDGANERARRGFPLSPTTQPPSQIPDFPEAPDDLSAQLAWTLGYATGYQLGASDSELAGADSSTETGLVSGMDEQRLEMLGVFKKMSQES